MNKHDPEWLKQSGWFKSLEKDILFPEKAIQLLIESDFKVEIYSSDEAETPQWVICPERDPSFWLNAFKTEQGARNFCREMEWDIVE